MCFIKMALPMPMLILVLGLINVSSAETSTRNTTDNEVRSLTIERTRAFSLLFSSLNCLSETDEATSEIREIRKNFHPCHHLHKYQNQSNVQLLLEHINSGQRDSPEFATGPFVLTPTCVSEIQIILGALFPNTDNWPLFYNTSAWLLGRVNGGSLYYALSVIAGEKFSDSVVAPSSVEVFPQMFINKADIATVAGLNISESEEEEMQRHPLHYFLSDPFLNEFHWNWHVDNPFFWNESIYPRRDRQGELFFYTHRQLVARYNAERISNGLPYVTALEPETNYQIPEPFHPDIININYDPYPSREEGTEMGYYDNGTVLPNLRRWLDNIEEGIRQGYLVAPDGSRVSLEFENASNILGYALGAGVPSPNVGLYGDFHGELHKLLAGMYREEGGQGRNIPGVQGNTGTALRDPVFFRLHKKVDELYSKLKTVNYEPYTRQDLDFPDIRINSFLIGKDSDPSQNFTEPPYILSTYFNWTTFDISTAARPCQGPDGEPKFATVKTLQHDPFNYFLSIQSAKDTKAFGMVRIFLLPQYGYNGTKLGVDESHQNAIQLDVFPVELEPGENKTIVRSSNDSSVTRMPLPGLKTLHGVTSSTEDVNEKVLHNDNKRACGFPNNLLIPKGTREGMEYTLFAIISEEPESVTLASMNNESPHYVYCGMLNGLKYLDRRSMGFPFDRPGTQFASEGGETLLDVDEETDVLLYGNVKRFPIRIVHRDEEDELNEHDCS